MSLVTELIEDSACLQTERSRTRLCAIMKLPQISDLPRPGVARTWEYAEWLELLKPFGFSEGEQTAHNYVIKHDQLPSLRVGMSTSPGDTRSRANFAQSVRYIFRNEYDRMTVYMKYVASKIDPNQHDQIESTGIEWLNSHIRGVIVRNYPSCKSDELFLVYRITEFSAAVTVNCSDGVMNEVRSLLAKACKRTKKSERELIKLVGIAPHIDSERQDNPSNSDSLIEAAVMCIRQSLALPSHTAALLVTGLKDIIDAEDAVREEAIKSRRNNKDRQPEPADESDDEPEDSTLVPVLTGKEYAQNFANVRGEFNKLCGPLVAALNDAIARAKAVSEYAASFPTPTYPTAFVAELQQRNAELSDKQEGWKTQVFEAQQRTIAAEHRLAELKESLTAATELVDEAANNSNWKTKYDGLVAQMTRCLLPNDFLALARGVEDARVILTKASSEL